MVHLCSQFQRSLLNVFLRVGEIEYTRTGEKSIGVSWVKPLLAIVNGKDGEWLSSGVWVSSLPVGNRAAAARCLHDCHAKKALSWDNTTLELRPGSLSHAEPEYAVSVCHNTGLVSFPEIPAGQGGQALNLSCEILCVVTKEFKALIRIEAWKITVCVWLISVE